MKPLFKRLNYFTFTFIFLLLSFFRIFMHQVGQDSFSIVLIELNPILSLISYFDTGLALLNSGRQIPANTVAGSISINWYIGSVITFLLYGAITDFIRFIHFKKKHGKLQS